MRMKWGIIAGVLGGIAAAEAGGSAYFYREDHDALQCQEGAHDEDVGG